VLINEILDGLKESAMPARLLHLVFNASSLAQSGVQEGLDQLRNAGCKIIISQVGQDLDLFEHLKAGIADYVMLDPELIGNVHASLMDEMMVTIVQGHAQRLGMKTIAGPTNQALMMDTLSGIGVDLIYGDSIAANQPLEVVLNTSYFAIN
jgi:EAL domain-containing protein (putative c-di-GMP-specific phosphodiesterase class I)